MIEHPKADAAHDAARREHLVSAEEREQARLELDAARMAPTPWQRSAHRLAAEVHASSAAAHDRLAAMHELEGDAAERAAAAGVDLP